jgi:hypothetical protein
MVPAGVMSEDASSAAVLAPSHRLLTREWCNFRQHNLVALAREQEE